MYRFIQIILRQVGKIKRIISIILAVSIMLVIFLSLTGATKNKSGNFIKYAEFNVCYNALEKALEYDISSHKADDEIKINWIEVLAYLGAKYSGDFKGYKEADMTDFEKVSSVYDKITEEELKQVIGRKELFIGMRGQEMAGFAGRHLEGSIGILPRH